MQDGRTGTKEVVGRVVKHVEVADHDENNDDYDDDNDADYSDDADLNDPEAIKEGVFDRFDSYLYQRPFLPTDDMIQLDI